MLRNRMRAGIERGEAQIGTWLTLVRDPSILMLMKSAGLDFARVDMEHTSLGIETIGAMAAMARALDFPIAVRPPAARIFSSNRFVQSRSRTRLSSSADEPCCRTTTSHFVLLSIARTALPSAQ